MPLEPAIPFYLAIGAYVTAALLSLSYLRGADIQVLSLATRMAAAGSILLAVVFAIRWWTFRLVPFTDMGDSLNLFLLLCTGIMLIVQREDAMRPLLAFYMPALGALALVSAVVGPQYLEAAPRELNSFFLTIHVGLAFLAFSLFFVASLTSMAYALQAQRLKRRMTTGLFQKLPSLELLDRTLYRLIAAGYPLFVITLVLGLYWARIDSELLGPYWFGSPKVVLAFVMAVFFSTSFHARRMGLLRGPKLAYLVFFGFTALLAVYLTLGFMRLGTHNFWDQSL